MIEVYLEDDRHIASERVAVFESEEVYIICLPSLNKYAKEKRMSITESVIDDEDN